MNIRELIEATRGDRSYADLANADPESPGRQRWQQLGAGEAPKWFPEPATIRGIARTLRVTPEAVVLAWAESLGIPMKQESRLAMLLPPGVERLSDSGIAALLGVVRELIPDEAPPHLLAEAQRIADAAHDSRLDARVKISPTGDDEVGPRA